MKTTDELLVEGVEALEGYLDEQEVACAEIKQGFLKLTKARLRLPEHALTEISYHEEFKATRVVTQDSGGNWRLQDASETKTDKENGVSSSLHRRRAGKSGEEGPTTSERSGVASNTLLWFSSLPPSDLRQAQKQFASGLQALLVAAASAEKVQQAVNEVTTALK